MQAEDSLQLYRGPTTSLTGTCTVHSQPSLSYKMNGKSEITSDVFILKMFSRYNFDSVLSSATHLNVKPAMALGLETREETWDQLQII